MAGESISIPYSRFEYISVIRFMVFSGSPQAEYLIMQSLRYNMKIGTEYRPGEGCRFSVWGPLLENVELVLVSGKKRSVPMERGDDGCWSVHLQDIPGDIEYFYRIDGEKERPDPASHFQSAGVHGPSTVIDHAAFRWDDADWQVMPLAHMIMYEIHVGTFTPEGTFEGVVSRLNDLKRLGINAIEIMPVSQFPGERNWGYDGAYHYAVQDTYGGPEGFKRLVNECHKKGIAVILDVVYNHLGPEGNYLRDFGPFFTGRYETPWGEAVNFDGEHSRGPREFFIQNALHWFEHYHIDALRLDAIHAIFDESDPHFLRELSERVDGYEEATGRTHYLIAESDLNDSTVVRDRADGGYGIDAQWCDDFHHVLHALLTGESDGYYMDFGEPSQIVRTLSEGYVYTGQYSKYRKMDFGTISSDIPAERFVVFSQNHDQTGNRMLGERLSGLVSFESLKLAAGLTILAPYIPLLFMGEEYGETAPFLYFVSHGDQHLVEAVRSGRKEEFRAFAWKGVPPDPQSPETFNRSRLDWKMREDGQHAVMLDFYRHLLKARKDVPAFTSPDKRSVDLSLEEDDMVLFMKRHHEESHVYCIFNFHEQDRTFDVFMPQGKWGKIIDSSNRAWNGPGMVLPDVMRSAMSIRVRGRSFAVYRREKAW